MTVNLLTAMINIANHGRNDLTTIVTGNNRANIMGDALEVYVRDAYCNTFGLQNSEEKAERHEAVFSYIGNSKNPPDFMVRGGEAVEVKKIEKQTKTFQLNSSNPKNKLLRSDGKITATCRAAENGDWNEKPLVYAIGLVQQDALKELFLVDGESYVADKEVYETVFERARNAVRTGFSDDELANTVEIAKISKTDALGSAHLRVRPMWILKHPKEVFSEYIHISENASINVVAILPKHKFENYDNTQDFLDIAREDRRFRIETITVPNPNTPEEAMEVVIIHLAVA